MTPKKMKAVSEAYQKILAIDKDLKLIKDMAEKAIENKGNAWISIDLESELIEQMQNNIYPTKNGYTIQYSTAEANNNNDGFTIDIPDTVLLEVLGVLLRHKQQLKDNESNNI